ncbi:MAG: extracellular solute-binding protein [Lachnospiraceae bacterium]|nr:extracellular solute-binding protein [Lachnospiraceae bacterium]
MKKRWFCLFLAIGSLIVLNGCGKEKQAEDVEEVSNQVIELTVWGGEDDEELLQELFASFEEHYRDQASFQITYQAQSESSCKDALLGDLEEGADVFAFADDQVAALAAAGALDPIEHSEEIRAANLPASVEAASVGNTLYAYPLTADNGYFLYYNKKYFSDKDIQNLNKMVEIAAKSGKHVTMDWSSAWYVYAFFGNTGLEVGLNEDGLTNYCTWNRTDGPIQGVDVAQAMLDIAASTGFLNCTDEEFLAGVKDGSVIAGISGVWNEVAIEEAWGDQTGAAKLPVYICKGEEVQMASFSGCKLIGVNAYSEHPEWSARLAEWLTNESSQTLRFEKRGQGPSNIQAASSAKVQESPAIVALLEQSEFSQLQRVGGKFWDPVTEFANNLAQGNPSGTSLQEQLDRLVESVTAR